MPPTKGTEVVKKNCANWKDADNAKLLSLLHPRGPIDPNDRGATNIKRLHQEWPNKSYKTFATLVRGKLEKICTREAIDGARRARRRLEGEYLVNC